MTRISTCILRSMSRGRIESGLILAAVVSGLTLTLSSPLMAGQGTQQIATHNPIVVTPGIGIKTPDPSSKLESIDTGTHAVVRLRWIFGDMETAKITFPDDTQGLLSAHLTHTRYDERLTIRGPVTRDTRFFVTFPARPGHSASRLSFFVGGGKGWEMDYYEPMVKQNPTTAGDGATMSSPGVDVLATHNPIVSTPDPNYQFVSVQYGKTKAKSDSGIATVSSVSISIQVVESGQYSPSAQQISLDDSYSRFWIAGLHDPASVQIIATYVVTGKDALGNAVTRKLVTPAYTIASGNAPNPVTASS